MMVEKKVYKLDSAIQVLAIMSEGCNFAPIYGVELININDISNKKNLEKGLKEQWGDSELSGLEKVEHWDEKLRELFDTWVFQKLHEGLLKNRESMDGLLFNQIIDYFKELMREEAGPLDAWHAKVSGGVWEYDAEILLIKENSLIYYFYFQFSD